MSVENEDGPGARASRVLSRGPAPVASATLREWARGFVRRSLLWGARPQARYQRELDEAIVAGLQEAEGRLERVDEQLERLEELARELVATAEALRRRISDVEAPASETSQPHGEGAP